MRVLFLAHRIPYPPNKGEKIRAFHEVRGLHERGHSVDLLAFADDPQDLQYAEALRRYATTVEVLPLRVSTAKLRALAALTGRTSLSLRYFELAGMHRAIRRRVQENPPQAVVVYSSTMAQYVPIALRARTVADLVDVDSAKWAEYSGRAPFPMSAVYATEATRLRAYEESLTGYFPHVVLTTPREVALLGHSRGAHVHALATGIDLSYFTPASPDSSAGGQTRIVFTGAMDYFANVDGACWFADEVLPRLARRSGSGIHDCRTSAHSRSSRTRRSSRRRGPRISARRPSLSARCSRRIGSPADRPRHADQGTRGHGVRTTGNRHAGRRRVHAGNGNGGGCAGRRRRGFVCPCDPAGIDGRQFR